MRRLGGSTLEFSAPPQIRGYASVGGRRESAGPLGGELDQCFDDTTMGDKSWEKAEARLQGEAASLALRKAAAEPEEIDAVFAGDLLNQCVASSLGLRSLGIPFLGQYGACSTMAQCLLMASILLETGAAARAMAVTSSHFCSAERQFRTPLEYGGQRAPTAQWTATAAGAVVLERPDGPVPGKVSVVRGLAGRIVDPGVKDPANMGAAMAPAAADSLLRFLGDTGTAPQDYDGVFTGDLGYVGTRLLYQLMGENGVDLAPVHNDCGLMLYRREEQDVHAGGSGCGCSAAVLCGRLLRQMERGELKNILFCATGALLSATSQQQGESIPGICHIVNLRTN